MSGNFYAQHSNNFLKFFKSGRGFDLILYVGYGQDRREFKVHTQILYAQSKYFRAALSDKWLKRKGNCYVFEKSNVEADVFEIILRYLYTGAVNIENCDGSQILKLLVASDEMNLGDLLHFAQNYLIESRKPYILEQPVQVLESIFRLESCKPLRLFCLDAICDDCTKLFESEDYLTLEEDIFAQILQYDKLYVKEVELWKYVLKWGAIRHSELEKPPTEWSIDGVNQMKKTLAALIECIRFFTMSAEEYYDEVRPYKKLFSKKLREEMLQFIMLPSRKPNDIMAQARAKLIDSRLVRYSVMAFIARWIDPAYDGMSYEFTLIYRASRDGFDNQNFRRICSSKGPTIVIAKLVNHPNVFGGYNPSPWVNDSYHYYSNADNSFVFEMPDGKSTAGSRIGRCVNLGGRQYNGYGPFFGSNFYINQQTWSSNTSGCNRYGIACSVASGTLEEYEVFTVEKKDQ
ncbi:10202_t:CDS:2 [Paraglomus occultum]|uniref:10202_t:CDS:1 n=1 Tax=Paraglomus occultum TaxID=144539 RepID=A0A9N9D6U8_9GLOM|nr:10202_t:CDS:2 [Paraglomus occultum]